MPYQLGDTVTLQITALASATVQLNVTAPDGTESRPTATNVSTTWSGSVTANQNGRWHFAWVITGTVDNVEIGSFDVDYPWYVSLTQLKSYLTGITGTTIDTELQDSISTGSRDIDTFCGRRFWKDTTATARIFQVQPDRRGVVKVSDFWTTDGLIIATDEGGDGTYETTWTTSDYQLEPLNGIEDGIEGVPYWKIRAINRTWPSNARASLQVTAKWGWSAVPAGVKSACAILGIETAKLAREAPFGVAGFGIDGIVRLRDNQRAQAMLASYRRDPVKYA
jgi:hypothetical protein